MGEEICFVSARCNSNPAPKSYGCRLPWGLPQEVSKCKAERKGSHVDHDEADEKFLEAPGRAENEDRLESGTRLHDDAHEPRPVADEVGRRDVRERQGAGTPPIECEQASGAEVRGTEEQSDHQFRGNHECCLSGTDQDTGNGKDEDARALGSPTGADLAGDDGQEHRGDGSGCPEEAPARDREGRVGGCVG